MEQIIAEHFSSSYRDLALIFNIDPIFIKRNDEILIIDELVFVITVDEEEFFVETGIFLNGKKEGFWVEGHNEYDIDTKKEGNYRNGLREGLWIIWHENGQKLSEGNYRNGEKEGLWVSWYENGQKRIEGNYQNGEQEGLWTYWYRNGQKASERNY